MTKFRVVKNVLVCVFVYMCLFESEDIHRRRSVNRLGQDMVVPNRRSQERVYKKMRDSTRKQNDGKKGDRKKKKTLKHQMRSLQRLLNSERRHIGPSERGRLEEKFRRLNESHIKKETMKKEIRYAVKYHEVKFIEKKKVARMLKKALKMPESENRTKALARCNDMENYLVFFPKDQKYISLFRNFDPSNPQYEGQQARLNKVRNAIMKRIKQADREQEVVTAPDEGLRGRDLDTYQKEIGLTPENDLDGLLQSGLIKNIIEHKRGEIKNSSIIPH